MSAINQVPTKLLLQYLFRMHNDIIWKFQHQIDSIQQNNKFYPRSFFNSCNIKTRDNIWNFCWTLTRDATHRGRYSIMTLFIDCRRLFIDISETLHMAIIEAMINDGQWKLYSVTRCFYVCFKLVNCRGFIYRTLQDNFPIFLL